MSRVSRTRDATRRADSLSRRRVAMGAGRKASTRLQRGPRRQAMLRAMKGKWNDRNDSKVKEDEFGRCGMKFARLM